MGHTRAISLVSDATCLMATLRGLSLPEYDLGGRVPNAKVFDVVYHF